MVVETLDTNVLNATTSSIETFDATYVAVFVVDKAGAHTTHVITLQVSPDNVNWFDTSLTVTGSPGKINGTLCIANYVRGKVTTVEGAVSTVDITLIVQ